MRAGGPALANNVLIVRYLASLAIGFIPGIGDAYFLASALSRQDLFTGTALSQHDRQLYAGMAAFSLLTSVAGPGLFSQEALAVERTVTELGDLERLGAQAAHGAEDEARAAETVAQEGRAVEGVARDAGDVSAEAANGDRNLRLISQSAYPLGSPGNEGELYRNLRPDEDPAQGLFPRNPNSGASIADHVRLGSKSWFPGSNYISTTRDFHIAREWQFLNKTRIAVIDWSKVPGRTYDLTTEYGRIMADISYPSREYSYGIAFQEVTIEGPIPAEAIIGVINP